MDTTQDTQEAHAVAAFHALANETRLRMLRCLVAAGREGMAAGDVARAVGASPSRASFHLAALAETGLVLSERAARQVTYRVDFAAIGGLVAYLLHDCCGNAPEVRRCCGLPAC